VQRRAKYFMVAEDIKKLRQITDALVKSDYLIDQTKEWEYVLDSMPDAIFIINCQYLIKFVNKKLAKLLGIDRHEAIDKSCNEVILSGNIHLCDFSNCKNNVTIQETYHLDSLHGWYQFIKSPIRSASGKILGFICILRDVTEAEIKKRELAVSEKKYRALVKHAPVGIYEIDFVDLKFKNVNDLMCEYTGYTRDELLSLDIGKLLTKQSMDLFLERIKRSMETKKSPSEVELEIVKKDGTTKWVKLHPAFQFNEAGLPIGAQVVAFDIDEEKKAKIELERKTRLLESIYRSSPGGIGVISYPDRIVVWINDRFCQIVGYEREELIGQNTRMLYHSNEEYEKVGVNHYNLLSKTNDVCVSKVILRHKTGSSVVVLLISARILGEEDRIVFNVVDLDAICNYINTDTLPSFGMAG